jgi:hypothetical protein
MDNPTAYEQIKQLLELCTKDQRSDLFHLLRKEFAIHPLEEKWNIQAEIILGAIDRANDITQRGVRGVITEAVFEHNVLQLLSSWEITPLIGDYPYDFIITDQAGEVRIQVKMQRLEKHQPKMMSNKNIYPDMFVVETQRTRSGKQKKTREDTRPYRFGEFDILAVSLQPSTKDWNSFLYTVANRLSPRPERPDLIAVLQPVPMKPNQNWTADLEECIRWFRSHR